MSDMEDLKKRIEDAERLLLIMKQDSSDTDNQLRLGGKIEGLRLVLDYMRVYEARD